MANKNRSGSQHQKPNRAAQQERKAREEAKAQALQRARTRMYVLGGTAVVVVVAIVVLVAGGSGSSGGPSPTPPAPSVSSSGDQLPGLQTGNAVWPPELRFLKQRLQDIGLPALSQEGTVLHIHQHLDIFIGGRKVPVPAGIGIAADESFIAPLHTHDATGIIHVESDVKRTFTLGQFFDVWGVRLDAQCIGGYCAGGGRTLAAFVGGKPYSGDPRDIELTSHEEIVLDFGNSSEQPARIPKSYHFPQGY